MTKVLVQIKNGTLEFKVRKQLTDEYKNMLNTNIISNNELLFNDEYMENNKNIISNFIKELATEYSISTVIIYNESIYELIIDLIKNIKVIDTLILKDETNLTYKITNQLCKCNYIKKIGCYQVQEFIIELLGKKDKMVDCESELTVVSKFMRHNNMHRLSDIYYKKTIIITDEMTETDKVEFDTFCSLNRYLKNIQLGTTHIPTIEYIVSLLKRYKKRNIKISIHEDVTDRQVLEYLSKFNSKYSKKYGIKFRIAYTNTFIQENYLPQTNLNILRNGCVLVILLVLGTFAYVFYDNYKVAKEVENTQSDIKESINKISDDELNKLKKDLISKIPKEEITINPDDNNEPDESSNENPDDKPENVEKEEPKINVNNDMVSLLAINDETVGWLSIKGTNIDYPVVQHEDNDFYLTRDFYKKNAYSGWVFMDYRNNYYDFDDNTIIYAHNRYSNGTMFGTLSRIAEKDWYENEENLIITYDTLFGTTKWEVFSAYKILTTSDYLENDFSDDDKRMEFFTMLKDRSSHDYGVEINASDKILTLSTCYKSNQRFVVHARLIKETNEN